MDALHDEVANHRDEENTSGDVHLDVHAKELRIGSGNGEADRLVHAQTGERRLALVGEQNPTQTCKHFEFDEQK